MADKMMRIAGRTSGGIAVPMLADSNGNISTTRTWKKTWETVIADSEDIRDTSSHDLPAVDVSGIPLYSLRVTNRLGTPITLRLKTDVNTSNGYTLADKDGVTHSFTVQPTNAYVIITPDDWPVLNYVKLLRLTVTAQSAPESGTFGLSIVSVM